MCAGRAVAKEAYLKSAGAAAAVGTHRRLQNGFVSVCARPDCKTEISAARQPMGAVPDFAGAGPGLMFDDGWRGRIVIALANQRFCSKPRQTGG